MSRLEEIKQRHLSFKDGTSKPDACNLCWLISEIERLEARLSAAEKVVEAVETVTEPGNRIWTPVLDRLNDTLRVYRKEWPKP